MCTCVCLCVCKQNFITLHGLTTEMFIVLLSLVLAARGTPIYLSVLVSVPIWPYL